MEGPAEPSGGWPNATRKQAWPKCQWDGSILPNTTKPRTVSQVQSGKSRLMRPKSYLHSRSRFQQLFPTRNSGIGIFIKSINWSRYAAPAWEGPGASGLDWVEGKMGLSMLRDLGSGSGSKGRLPNCPGQLPPLPTGAGPQGCLEAASRPEPVSRAWLGGGGR